MSSNGSRQSINPAKMDDRQQWAKPTVQLHRLLVRYGSYADNFASETQQKSTARRRQPLYG